jgi:hypothetical protein
MWPQPRPPPSVEPEITTRRDTHSDGVSSWVAIASDILLAVNGGILSLLKIEQPDRNGRPQPQITQVNPQSLSTAAERR